MSDDKNNDFDDGFGPIPSMGGEEAGSELSEDTSSESTNDVWEEAMKEQCQNRDKISKSPLGTQAEGLMDSDGQEHDDLTKAVLEKVGIVDRSILENIQLDIKIVAGTLQMKIGDLLKLNTGSSIETDSHKDDALEVWVNGVCVAKGDLCLINDMIGIRLTEVVNDRERLLSRSM